MGNVLYDHERHSCNTSKNFRGDLAVTSGDHTPRYKSPPLTKVSVTGRSSRLGDQKIA